MNEKHPSMKRRCLNHDYYEPGLYMLTVVVEGRHPLLGTLIDDGLQPRVELSRLGFAILNEEVPKVRRYYPMVEVWKTCIMPDHIHMIINVMDRLPVGNHLGVVVRGFKSGCSRAWWRMAGGNPAVETAGTEQIECPVPALSSAGKRRSLFESGYNDKILWNRGQLNNWFNYLDDNPRRLAVKRRCPQYFTVMHDVEIAGHKCQVVGNRFLLDVPDKVAVIVHRRYSPQECERLRQQWLAAGEAGGVLVSAAIAPMEKEVMRCAMQRGYNVIVLRENGFPPLYKPEGENFDACTSGRLLLVSPWLYHTDNHTITREQCLMLNDLAQNIVND